MKIGIIVEGNEKIGLGHIIRCKAIVEYLRNNMTEVFFIIPETVDRSLIKDFETISVPLEKWDNINKNQEFFEAILQSFNGVLLDLVEVKFIEFSFLSKLQLFIASLTLFQFRDESYFGNISFFPTVDTFSLKLKTTEMKAGPEYFIIHDKIRKVTRKPLSNKKAKILISMGGADPCNITEKTIRAVQMLKLDFQAIIIAGKANKNKEKIRSLVEGKENFIYYDFVKDIEDIYSEIDFAIINGGNTRYELTLLQIPYACISIHEVQFNINKKVTDLYGGVNIGIYSKISEKFICDEIEKTLNSPENLIQIKESMKKFKGGKGHEVIGNNIIENIKKGS